MAGQLTDRQDSGLVGATGSVVPGRRRAEHAEAGSARATLLSRAGRLLGTSLDTGRTLAAIAELVVPSFADQCVVDLLEETGVLRRAVTVRMDRERSRRASLPGPADRRVVYPPEHPCAVALRTGGAGGNDDPVGTVTVDDDGLGTIQRVAGAVVHRGGGNIREVIPRATLHMRQGKLELAVDQIRQ